MALLQRQPTRPPAPAGGPTPASPAPAATGEPLDADQAPPPAPPVPRRRRRWLLALLVAGGLVLAVVGGAALYVWWPRPATPITADEAVDDFRAAGPADGVVVGGIAPGVYRYAVDGVEHVDIGVVPLPSRDLPAEATLVVVDEGACQRRTLNLMAEHTEATTWCPDGAGGWVLTAQDKVEEVAGFTTIATTTCAAGAVGTPGGPPRPLACTMGLEVAGTTFTVELRGTASWTPAAPVEVGGVAVGADQLTLELDASGDFDGHWVERHLVEPGTGVPVRIERDIVLDGAGRFEEVSTLELLDLVPLR